MKFKFRAMIWFALGMLAFALGAFIVTTFFLPTGPEQGGIIQDWGEICIWQDVGGITLTISPRGCYSSTCTQIKQQTGSAVIDLQNQKIILNARFVLVETSRFPLRCTGDCFGGGRVQFSFTQLIPNDYTLWYVDQEVGLVNIFSGRTTPRQCFTNPLE